MIAEILSIPGLILILGALLLALIPATFRGSAFLLFPVLALASVWMLPDGYRVTMPLADLELVLIEVDALSRIFGLIFAMITLFAGIYAWHLKDLSQQLAALVYAGGTLGVTYAGDFFTLIVFWELMAISSTWLVWANRNPASDAAGMRYLVYHVLGGGILLAGVLLHVSATGSILITSLPESTEIGSVLMLAGVAINTAIIPLHSWLPDAYPKATITGAVFMSALTTKSAVYVLIRVFPGWELLVWFGAAMAVFGVLYAVICKDLREILSYHILSQVGFMVCGIGIGTELALNGAAAHAFNNILYKTLMFMAAGAVLYATGTTKLVELGGLKKKMKWTLMLYMVGAFSISGLPLFTGFISKTMTISAAGYAGYESAMLFYLLAGVGTFLSVGLKLPYYTWFHKSEAAIETRPIPFNMYIGMGAIAFLCIFYGLFPNALYSFLPYPTDFQPYSVYNLVEIIQISLFTFVGFWIFRKKLAGERMIALDVDWFYRKAAPAVRRLFVEWIDDLFGKADHAVYDSAARVSRQFDNPMRWLNPISGHRHEARTYSSPTGTVTAFLLLIILVFGIYLIGS